MTNVSMYTISVTIVTMEHYLTHIFNILTKLQKTLDDFLGNSLFIHGYTVGSNRSTSSCDKNHKMMLFMTTRVNYLMTQVIIFQHGR